MRDFSKYQAIDECGDHTLKSTVDKLKLPGKIDFIYNFKQTCQRESSLEKEKYSKYLQCVTQKLNRNGEPCDSTIKDKGCAEGMSCA